MLCPLAWRPFLSNGPRPLTRLWTLNIAREQRENLDTVGKSSDTIPTPSDKRAPSRPQSDEEVSTPMDKSQRSLRILLAEDNVVNQKVVTSMLQKRGHQVVVAEDGKKAVTAFEGGVFDLVLMDVHMPEMDGFEATAAIRESQKSNGTHTPIVAMTANAMQGDRERCLEAGMDGYIPKPVKAKELFRGVEEAVDSSSQTPINDLANQSAHGAFV